MNQARIATEYRITTFPETTIGLSGYSSPYKLDPLVSEAKICNDFLTAFNGHARHWLAETRPFHPIPRNLEERPEQLVVPLVVLHNELLRLTQLAIVHFTKFGGYLRFAQTPTPISELQINELVVDQDTPPNIQWLFNGLEVGLLRDNSFPLIVHVNTPTEPPILIHSGFIELR